MIISAWLLGNFFLITGFAAYQLYFSKYGGVSGNRFFLLGWLGVSGVLPFIPFEISNESTEVYNALKVYLPTLEINAKEFSNHALFNFLENLFLIVSLALTIKMGVQFFKVKQLINRSSKRNFGKVTYYLSNEIEMPFSYFGFIVLPETILKDSKKVVILHEYAHKHLHHSIDLLVIQLVQLFNWFNPVVWFYEKAMRMNHEFEADQYVLNHQTDVNTYKAMLLSAALRVSDSSLIHAMANQSQLQKRFSMMNTTRVKSKWNYLMLVPLVGLALIAKSCTDKTDTLSIAQEEEVEKATELEELVTNEPEIHPTFKGGQKALMDYLIASISYPKEAKENGVTGKVFIAFIIDENGAVNQVRPLKKSSSNGEYLAEFVSEAERVIKNMPNWQPGEMEGEKVAVEMVLPIQFAL